LTNPTTFGEIENPKQKPPKIFTKNLFKPKTPDAKEKAQNLNNNKKKKLTEIGAVMGC